MKQLRHEVVKTCDQVPKQVNNKADIWTLNPGHEDTHVIPPRLSSFVSSYWHHFQIECGAQSPSLTPQLTFSLTAESWDGPVY